MRSQKIKNFRLARRGNMQLDFLGEFTELNQFLKSFSRSPMQTNSLYQSDAEIVQLSQDNYLAISLDIVGDEQSWGLITNFKNMGKHALESALSDLAAVGVDPKGFIQCLIIGKNQTNDHVESLLAGINEASIKNNLFLFGGDTASGELFSLHLTVLGHSQKKPISRFGMAKGDCLYTTCKAGRGNSLVARRLLGRNDSFGEADYLAKARLQESHLIRNYASCMIDSSDGFLNSLDLLVRVNNIGISCESSLDSLLHPLAREAQKEFSLSPWAFLAGEFGDYELIFSVPFEKAASFENDYNQEFNGLLKIGTATEIPELKILNSKNNCVAYDASVARNLYKSKAQDQSGYIQDFLALGKQLGF